MYRKTLFILFFITVAFVLFSAEADTLLLQGKQSYARSEWQDAIFSLRRAASLSESAEAKGEAFYWLALSQIALGDWAGAWKDLEALSVLSPDHPRSLDSIYQRGRVLYYQAKYEDAISTLKTYTDLEKSEAKTAAAFYWVGESLFALGRLEDAKNIFAIIIERWPSSAKYEAAVYRMALIEQKAIEEELLTLLKWTHEESLKTFEDYKRRERSYEQAIVVYQKRSADMLKDTRLADLESENKGLRLRLAHLEQEIQQGKGGKKIEERTEQSTLIESSFKSSEKESDFFDRLESLKLRAVELERALMKKLAEEDPHD